MSEWRGVKLSDDDYELAKALGHGDVYIGLERALAWARVRVAWYNEAGRKGFPGFIAEITNVQTTRERELEARLCAIQTENADLHEKLNGWVRAHEIRPGDLSPDDDCDEDML